MSRALNDLAPEFRPLAFELLARLCEAGIPVMIIDTLRTETEQQANLAKGVSKTMNSKHLPQQPSGKSKAIDVCPYETFFIAGPDKLKWDTKDPVWQKIGLVGKAVGGGGKLIWGGDWKKNPSDLIGWDPGHFELKE